MARLGRVEALNDSAGDNRLAAAFLGELGPSARSRFARQGDLAQRLDAAVGAAQAAARGWEVDGCELVAHAARKLGDAGTGELDSLRWAELHLALACARGIAAAVGAFDARFLQAVVDPAERQLAREHLLVRPAPDQLPRIASYDGRSALRDWTRIVIARALSDRRRRREHEAEKDDQLEELAAVVATGLHDDPGAAHLRSELALEIKAAFERALRALTPQQRTLLRLRYLHGTSVDDIARLYNRHRVSMSRRISKTQSELLSHTRRYLRAHTSIAPEELEATVALVNSRLDLSLQRLLRSHLEES